jgi:hypothetical protein
VASDPKGNNKNVDAGDDNDTVKCSKCNSRPLLLSENHSSGS